MKAIEIKTEYLENPIGLSISHPRIRWKDLGGEKQTGFCIQAVSSQSGTYDSGKILSSSMHYDFPFRLHSRERIMFRIAIYDEKGETEGYGEEHFFERGLLKKEDYSASFITGDYHPKKGVDYPVDYFQKEFELKVVKSARLSYFPQWEESRRLCLGTRIDRLSSPPSGSGYGCDFFA